ncbi:MAG: hypothetical protein AB1457_01690 [Chloroflexota bacterium]|nr:MAG: hypothetical protein KatS3mg047_0675 [Bellilinea sp.]
MNPVEENSIQEVDITTSTQPAPVLPIMLELDEETIQILLDDQIATGG